MTQRLTDRYEKALQAQGFQHDPDQARAVAALQRVQDELSESRDPGWLARLLGKRPEPVTGLYMWGGVGRGKTWLMDLFYASLPTRHKGRWHFHRFMAEVHDELKRLKHREDPLLIVADHLARRVRVICFDEFFVSDIADAMILGTLFTALFERGVTLVATSNIPPDDLYKDGLQRARFLPAIDVIKQHVEVMNVDSGVDYRLRELEKAPLFYHPDDADAEMRMRERFTQFAHGGDISRKPLTIHKRRIPVRKVSDGVVWFDFAAICDGPRSQNDYIEIARLFHTVLISGLPQLTWETENAARRFIALVDEFYDRRVKLLLAAEVAMPELYAGEKLKFEFERTLSRLQEMQSREYLAEAHRP